jgi:acyl-CoA synthetase (AMP-forming)/AMP-acid ligase II
MYKKMLREDDLLGDTDCSSLRFVICGSSEVPEELLEEFSLRLAPMLEAYGLTECGFVCNNPRWGVTKQGTTGLPYPGVELRIVDPETRTDVATGDVGEIWVRSPQVMKGYWNNDAANAQALRDGWLWTGDLGSIDADGFITLKDRSKDLIISGGANIYPREIEEVLLTHAAVLETAVVSRPHPDWGEEVIAFVVRRTDAEVTAAELDRLCLDNIARFKRPKGYRFVEALPKNNYGKILKTELREQAKREQAS